MINNKGITLIKLVIIIVVILVLIGVGLFLFLNKDNIFYNTENLSDLEIVNPEKNKRIAEFLMNNEEESEIEQYITIDQENYVTTEANQKLSGKNLIGKEINKMWFEQKSEFQTNEYEKITYTNDEWKIESLKLIPNENEITIFAQIEDKIYQSKPIKIYYDSGESYDINPDNIKYDEKEDRYYNNIVLIKFKDEVSETRRFEIVKAIKGKVVGRLNILDEFHVEVSPRSLSKMRELCSELEKLEEVRMAFLDGINVTEKK